MPWNISLASLAQLSPGCVPSQLLDPPVLRLISRIMSSWKYLWFSVSTAQQQLKQCDINFILIHYTRYKEKKIIPTKTRTVRFAVFRIFDVLLKEIELKELHLKRDLAGRDMEVEKRGWTRRKFRVIKVHDWESCVRCISAWNASMSNFCPHSSYKLCFSLCLHNRK